jgi:cytochrome P450
MRLPLELRPATSLPPEYIDLFREHPTRDVELPDGTAAVAVARHCDVRTVLSDDRFSRAEFAHTAGTEASFGLVTSDPPQHTMRRRALRGWLTTRRAQQARPNIERVADQLIDAVVGEGPPADLYTRFCQPFPIRVHMDLLGLDAGDLPYLAPLLRVAWAVGRHPDGDITRAGTELRAYLHDRVVRARGAVTGGGMIDALAQEDPALTDAEIVMLGMGLLMAGAETTASHLALCLIGILERPGLADGLRRNPADIPAAVEELLRWVWFDSGADRPGQPHVATAAVRLHDRLIAKGQIVIPMADLANRDPDVFPDADEFCPHRAPNPHLGFGHGRHQCIGMAFARVQLHVGLHVVLSRLDGITLHDTGEIGWCRGLFTRGVSSLPVTWREGGGR